MASFPSFLTTSMVFMAYFTSPAFTSQLHVQSSTISAAPAFLPQAPLSSPSTLSPDILPVWPTTGARVPSPSQSSLPNIPSNPSPPNPDLINPAPVPVFAVSPPESLPDSSSTSLSSSPVNLALYFLGLMAFGLMHFSAF